MGESFEKLFERAANKRIIIATFASNVHRIQQVVDTAVRFGRKVAVFGRSMVNVVAIAQELGRTHHVLVGGREPRAVAEAAARIPGATPFVADLTDERQLAEATRSIRRLDVLGECLPEALDLFQK